MMLSKLLNNRRFWLAIALLSLLLLCCFTPVTSLFDKVFLVEKLHKLGHWSVCIFVLIYTVATIFGVPGTVLTVAAGAVFGLFWGTFWSVVGATLGAIGAFLVARYLFHNWAERRFGHHQALVKFKKAVIKKPLAFVLAVRFTPVSPFNVVNFLFGLTPIRCRDYAVGTFLGIIPGTLAYTWLGVTGEQALHGGDILPFLLALSFLALLSIFPVFLKKKGIGNR
jgi:uncharacterized membrane protein YdjX (TVP38/TMEM64 family)